MTCTSQGRVGKPFNWFNHASFSARLQTRGENWKTINWFNHASFSVCFKTRGEGRNINNQLNNNPICARLTTRGDGFDPIYWFNHTTFFVCLKKRFRFPSDSVFITDYQFARGVVHCCHWVPVFLTICHMCGSCFHWLLGIFTSRQESGCFFLYWFRQFVRKAIHFAVVGFYATIWFMLWLPQELLVTL